jgi:hypothetical protein
MSTSLPQVVLPSKQWVDLYDATGITLGTKLIIQNTGGNEVRLVESLAQPELNSGFNVLYATEYLTSAAAPVGSWAYAHTGTTLHVEEA